MNEINAHAPTSLRERVYLELRDEVLGGRIGPTERLTEPRLSKRFGVSRTPVRDALNAASWAVRTDLTTLKKAS